MLTQFRRYTDSWIARLFFILMAVSFVGWGISSDLFRLMGPPTWIAKVGGETIEIPAFQAEYQRAMAQQTRNLPSGQEPTADQRRQVGQQTLDRMVAEISAVGETLACALLSACMTRAKDRTLRALFSAIVADEVHHARLGWYYFAWRAPQWTRTEKQRMADRAGEAVLRIEPRFWRGRDAPPSSRKGARALGVLESEGQREAVHFVMEDEIVPALDALGLGSSHAWRIRQRGGG